MTIDTPLLGMVLDAAVIAKKRDGAMIVVGSNNSKNPQVQDVITQIWEGGCNMLGPVLNKCIKEA